MPKQAVLLIHGIGEQRPMDSIRAFVEAVWTTDTARQREHGADRGGVWSKPYGLEENFELRRLTTATNREGWRTDFFEFYWAHLMTGTQLGHVWAWAKTLLWRSPKTVPQHLRLAYWALWTLVVAAIAISGAAALTRDSVPVWVNLVVSAAFIPLIHGILTQTVGDAARYLHVAPTNVQRRHEIRAAGIKVLKSLHERDYDRIIVVGHSLGSVIAYDVLNHAWATYNTDAPTAANPSFAALTELEAVAADARTGDIERVRTAQRAYFNELRSNGARWRVSDFVTLGSPLAHAQILLAQDRDALARVFASREFPTCLPVLETRRHNNEPVHRFSFPPNQAARTPDHSAVFAPVRWTNLFFPNTWLLWGDPIGGSLQPIFGSGVLDVPVSTTRNGGLFSHTFYWTMDPQGGPNTHIHALRDAMDLLDAANGAPAP